MITINWTNSHGRRNIADPTAREGNQVDFDATNHDPARAVAFDPERSARKHARRFALVRVSARIDASPERIFDAWLDPGFAGRWLFATASRPMTRVAIDARVRGRFRFADGRDGDRVEHHGVYVEIERPRRLAFTLSAAHGLPMTRVIADIAPGDAAGAAELTVTHADVPGDFAARTEARWTGMLYGLGQMLDSEPGLARPRSRRGRR